MKKVFTIIAFVHLLAVTIACSNDDDGSSSSFEYAGNWSGTFTGGDTGIWQVNIESNGEVNGSFIMDQLPDFEIPLEGQVDSNGNIEATYGNEFISGEFAGEMDGSTASGEWTNNEQNLFGTWEGSKN